MPSTFEWESVEMKNAGQDRYTCTVPLTAEGVLYYFEAADSSGNAANYPEFLRETPYFVKYGQVSQ
jgi:hypothetical protein